jgi:hypothetical protein
MTNQRTDEADHRRKWVFATCAGLFLAAVGDAGPEIIESRSLVAGYDGPGPLVCLGFAAVVVAVRWRFAPLLAVAMSAFFLLGGFSDADFANRLITPTGVADFVGAWLQMLSFAAVIVCGTAAVRWRGVRSPVRTQHH